MYFHVIHAKMQCDKCKKIIDLKFKDKKPNGQHGYEEPEGWSKILCHVRTPTGRYARRGGYVETQFCAKCTKKHPKEHLQEVGNELMRQQAIDAAKRKEEKQKGL